MLPRFCTRIGHLCSRIRLLIRRRPKVKLMIRRLKKKYPRRITLSVAQHQGQRGDQISQGLIRVASFNVALFSLAPAIPKHDSSSVPNNEDTLRKSILKQSPLHMETEHQAKKVSINLPENEISLAQKEEPHVCRENHVPMRSPICFPSNMVGWMDDHGRSSILDVLKQVDADILALQDVKAEEEKGMRPLSDLALALGMNYAFAESWAPEYGNAILSKWPIRRSKVQKIYDDQDFRNVLKATIDVPSTGDINFYCTQLDHLDEGWRMKQIDAIIQSSDRPHILAGGINSLSRSDYSLERWTNIVKYYEQRGKPTPRTEVTEFLIQNDYTDAKHFMGECEPVVIVSKGQSVQGTCKYGTRVDYILASKGLSYRFVPGSYSVVSSKGSSDHHIVKVDLAKVNEDCGDVTGGCWLKGMWSFSP